jgi:MoaA/NifB/PqqE/SkfB family radical SAM enzyme
LIHTIEPTRYPNLSICLQTNGLLFSEEAWFALGPARSIVRTVAVSIDAATPDTYVVNRRGGDWWKLQQRLEFIARLRRSGPIRQLRFCFVVQANNFREMPDFIEFARRSCADMVFFTPLRNCGTYGDGEFCRRNVHAPEHPEHGEYLKLCRHIPPVVRLSGAE